MTAPFDRLIGRSAPTLPREETPVGAEALPVLRDLQELTQALDANRGNFRRIVDESRISGLSSSIERGLIQARNGHPIIYSTVAKLLAVRNAYSSDPEEQEAIRRQMRGVVEEGCRALLVSSMPTRDQVRALYDMALAYSSLLASSTGIHVSDEDRGILRNVYVQIQARIEQSTQERQTEISRDESSRIEAIPAYWSSYARAQSAMLDGNSSEALAALLETRDDLRSLTAPSSPGGFRYQVATSTDLALQALRVDTRAFTAEVLRSSTILEALGYFYLVDEIETHSEEILPEAQRDLQRFHFVASVLLQEAPGLTASQVLEHLSAVEGEARSSLRTRLEEILSEHPLSSQALQAMGLSEGDETSEVATHLLNSAVTLGGRLQERREAEPFRYVLDRDADHRHIQEATQELERHTDLQSALRSHLGLPEDADVRHIVRAMLEYGELLSTLRNALPEAVRQNRSFENFFRQLRYATQGMENLPEHLRELTDLLVHLSEDDEHYAPAYLAFFESLHQTEEIIPGVALPSSLRRRAELAAQNLQNFSFSRVLNHLTSPSSLAMILGGSILSELGPILLLRGAGTAGELGSLVRGGAVTLRGEMLVGTGVAVSMSLGGSIAHLATSPRPASEEFPRILPGLAIGTLLSVVAMMGTMGLGRALRGRLLPGGMTPSFGRLATLRFGTFTGAGALMLGANYGTRGILTGHWEAPNGEEIAETFLTMAAWDLAAMGWRGLGHRLWWRQQIGPRLSGEVTRRVGRMIELNADLGGQRGFLENYLGFRLASGRGMGEVADALDGDLIPVMEGEGSGRRLRFLTREAYRTLQARHIKGLESTGRYREVQIILENAEHPLREGLEEAREQLQEMLTRDANASVLLRIHRSQAGGPIQDVTIHRRQPASPGPHDIFLRVTRTGISGDEINRTLPATDAVTRMTLEALVAEIFGVPLSPRPAALAAAARASETETTAALRPLPIAGPEPAAFGSEVSPTASIPRAEPEAATASSTPSSTGTEEAAPPPTSALSEGSAEGSTSPRQPGRALLAASRPQPSSREETRPITTGELARARDDSRSMPRETIGRETEPEAAPPIRSEDGILIDRDRFLLELQHLLQRFAEQARWVRAVIEPQGGVRFEVLTESSLAEIPDRRNIFFMEHGRIQVDLVGEEAPMNPSLRQAIEFYRTRIMSSQPLRPRRRSPTPAEPISPPAPAGEVPSASEPGVSTEESQVDFVLGEEDAFSDVVISQSDTQAVAGPLAGVPEGLTLRPPGIPREAAAIPPPLPPRAPRREGEGIPSEGDSAPILLIRERERVREGYPITDATRTAGPRVVDSIRYADISQRVLDLISELEGICRSTRPRPEFFHVAVSRAGEMSVIPREQYLRREDLGYFILRRVRVDLHSSPRDVFYLEGEPVLPEDLARLGLATYLPRWFGRNADYEPR